MLYAIVAVMVIIADQWVKFFARSIPANTAQDFIPGILKLTYVENDGAAFSILQGGGARYYFIILTGVFVLAVIIALATNFISGRLARWSIVLVAAGGLSNCIDRVIFGHVVDMFQPEFINFPVFNLADVFITVFCLIFVLAILFEREPEEEDDDLYDDEEEDLPRRPSAREKRAARVAAKSEAAEKKAKRKATRDREDDEYEAYKAERAARQRQQAQAKARAQAAKSQGEPAKAARPAAESSEDPFAEWERANARVQSMQSGTQRPAAQRPAQRPAAPKSAAAPAPSARPAAQPAPVAAPKAKPAPAPAAAPKAEASTEEFSLEDILAEFK